MSITQADFNEESIVLEIGSAFARIGLSGEHCCRFSIPFTGNPLIPMSTSTNSFMPLFVLPLNEQQMESVATRLTHLMHAIFTRYMPTNLVNLVLVQTPHFPTQITRAILTTLFTRHKIEQITLIPDAYAGLVTTGCATGSVVDVGIEEVRVWCVVEGGLSGHACLQWRLSDIVKEVVQSRGWIVRGGVRLSGEDEAAAFDSIDTWVWEEIKHRYVCYGNRMENGGVVDYKLSESEYLHFNRDDVCGCGESLFEDSNESLSLQRTFLDIIKQMGVDTRRALLGNVLVMGGSSSMVGYKQRLNAALSELLDDGYMSGLESSDVVLAKPVFPSESLAWIGASLLGSLNAKGRLVVKKDNYLADEVIPQWEDHITLNR